MDDKRQKCSLCRDQVWSEKTSSTVIESHFESVHLKLWKQRPIAKAIPSSQTPIAEALKIADVQGQFDRVVELFIRHPGLPLTLCNSNHFKLILKCPIQVKYRNVRKAIIEKDEKYFAQFKERLKGKKVGIQIDGAKAVNGIKQIGVCVVVDGECFCFKIVFVGLHEILSAEWYKDLLLDLVNELELLGAIAVSVTMDNEASPNAGMRLLLEIKPHLIHNRCGPHTAELLIEDLQSVGTVRHPTLPAIPLLHDVIKNVHDVVTCILNSKYLKAALFEAQKGRLVQRPLTLVKPANTRKWSTGFLMLSRFCSLYNDIAAIENYLAAGTHPANCEQEAKALWLSTQKPLVPNRIHVEAVMELLYWIYVGEQAMQKDGASIIHVTHIFEDICCALESDLPNHRVPRIIRNDMDSTRVRASVQARRELLQTSGLYWLSLVLWPKPTSYAYDHHSDANNELEEFITRCWPQWQQNRDELRLPSRYHVLNASDNQAKLDDFTNDVQEELTEHLLSTSQTITRHQTSFESRSAAVLARLRAGDRVVKRSRPDETDADPCRHVRQYWAAVTSQLPLLSMIARLLLACCGSEAAVERLFSQEGFIHDCYRNSLNEDVLLALVRSHINRKFLDDEPLRSDASSSDSDSA
jgi:hypothetical protein